MLHLLSLLEVQIFAFLLKLIIPLHGLSKPQMKATILDFEFVLCHLACSKGFLGLRRQGLATSILPVVHRALRV